MQAQPKLRKQIKDTTCPQCGKPADKETVKDWGECLACDHIKTDNEQTEVSG